MENMVKSFIKKHYLLTRNATVLIGVSGGPDSMALLHFLYTIRNKWNLNVIALSVDHQLRGEESKADLYYVKEVCEQWGIEFRGTSLDVPLYKQKKQVSTELAARELRYQFYAEQMEEFQADYLALGHHGDDQVETMLMSLVRSASSSALSGIPVKREFSTGNLIRPLLCVTKKDLEMYCQDNKINPRIDSSNNETEFTRNFFRNNIIPLIKEKNNNIHTTIQHMSETIHEDEQFLHNEALAMFRNIIEFDYESSIASFEIDVFKRHAYALQRRVFHLILNYLYDELPKDLSYVHEEQFFSMLQKDKGNVQIDFPHHLKLERSYNKLVFYFTNLHSENPFYHFTLDIPGTLKLPDGSSVTGDIVNHYKKQDRFSYFCNTGQIALPLHIRTRRSGDRMSWRGLNGSKKLKDIFIDAKIPKKERDNWPILVDNNGEILWLIGLKKGQPQKQSKYTSYIQLVYTENNV
ncbi:tRNA lysidine(34) synthetase TilS [Virgibacillus profundi]|uniref:tRNA(Ile)-lysidine synthase n=1 Tax=Virgibacillus profundi TaxID=2024555 RepID=A0A2A2IB16_9BACI|nr:tRNA lysidine(34) synthetase TilS [Virgibacillus profundi]PAV28578.1 tRNA lysidine(34) synthetase TilS [Virgibacillus profundi]PXY52751.1 tRNA lysidine(34) synthetase TilS [Virgibacillus profundi]